MALPPGRYPLGSDWVAEHLARVNTDIKQMQRSRDFPVNTCPASRHTQSIAEGLVAGGYPMLASDPEHCGGSIASTVRSLYEARSFLHSLGYTWRVNDEGKSEWIKADDIKD